MLTILPACSRAERGYPTSWDQGIPFYYYQTFDSWVHFNFHQSRGTEGAPMHAGARRRAGGCGPTGRTTDDATIRPPLSSFEIEAQCGAVAAPGGDGRSSGQNGHGSHGGHSSESARSGAGSSAGGGAGGDAVCATSCALSWEPGLACWEVADEPFEARGFGYKQLLDALQA